MVDWDRAKQHLYLVATALLGEDTAEAHAWVKQKKRRGIKDTLDNERTNFEISPRPHEVPKCYGAKRAILETIIGACNTWKRVKTGSRLGGG